MLESTAAKTPDMRTAWSTRNDLPPNAGVVP